jgi:hypothetical protein
VKTREKSFAGRVSTARDDSSRHVRAIDPPLGGGRHWLRVVGVFPPLLPSVSTALLLLSAIANRKSFLAKQSKKL